MRVVFCALALSAGCSFSPGMFRAGDDTPDDAAVDSIDDPDGAPDMMTADAALCSLWTPTPKHFMPCAIPTPSPALVITAADSPWKLDTTTGVLSNTGGTVTVATQSLTQTNGPEALLVSVEGLTVEAAATLDISGTKPLVVASFGDIVVMGTLDVTSRLAASQPGAGANPATCATTPPTTGQGELGVSDVSGGGSGGGGGGGFRGTGGKGGPGDSGAQNEGGDGGLGLVEFPTVVRGGCAGAASGMAGSSGANSTRRAAGGAGGGAIQLSSRTSIVINGGRVLAGGSGGAGSANGDANGGGGGGAGGYIGLEAPMVNANAAVLAANGGGGGGSAPFAGTGVAGQNGQASATAANGGDASSCSHAGGTGSSGAMLNGTAANQTTADCGGGGGGGAAGFIGVFSAQHASQNSVVSPASQLNPF